MAVQRRQMTAAKHGYYPLDAAVIYPPDRKSPARWCFITVLNLIIILTFHPQP